MVKEFSGLCHRGVGPALADVHGGSAGEALTELPAKILPRYDFWRAPERGCSDIGRSHNQSGAIEETVFMVKRENPRGAFGNVSERLNLGSVDPEVFVPSIGGCTPTGERQIGQNCGAIMFAADDVIPLERVETVFFVKHLPAQLIVNEFAHGRGARARGPWRAA